MLIRELDFNEKYHLATCSSDEDVLRQLAKDDEWRIRIKVCKNTDCPIDVIEHLQDDPIPEVQFAIASNPNTPMTIIKKYASFGLKDVRIWMAERDGYPREIYELLSQSESGVLKRLAEEMLESFGS